MCGDPTPWAAIEEDELYPLKASWGWKLFSIVSGGDPFHFPHRRWLQRTRRRQKDDEKNNTKCSPEAEARSRRRKRNEVGSRRALPSRVEVRTETWNSSEESSMKKSFAFKHHYLCSLNSSSSTICFPFRLESFRRCRRPLLNWKISSKRSGEGKTAEVIKLAE